MSREIKEKGGNLVDGLATEADNAAGKSVMTTLHNITHHMSGRRMNKRCRQSHSPQNHRADGYRFL
jgi:hypothetical protein